MTLYDFKRHRPGLSGPLESFSLHKYDVLLMCERKFAARAGSVSGKL